MPLALPLPPSAAAGGGSGTILGEATFSNPIATSNFTFLNAYDSVGNGAIVHTFTLGGAYARGLKLTVVSGTVTGNVVVSGLNPAGGSHNCNITQAAGDSALVFSPGEITVTVTGASARYSIGLTDLIGLPAEFPAKAIQGNAGLALGAMRNGAPAIEPELFITDYGLVYAAALAGGFGAWKPSAYGNVWDGTADGTVYYPATAPA